MLKEIQKAIEKVFSSYEVSLTTNNEILDDRDTFASLLSVEILKEVTAAPQPTSKTRKRKQEQEPAPEASITFNAGGN